MRSWIILIAVMCAWAPARAQAAMEDYPSVKLQGLDKSTARTTTFEAKVGSTITYGPLFIRIQACRKSPPIETPESAAFLQIWEVPPETGKSEWVFSGWMFASSPALSAMDHPVYDVWVLDCLGREEPNEEAKQSETDATVESQEELAAPVGTTPAADTPAPAATETEEEVIDSEADMGDGPAAVSPAPAAEDEPYQAAPPTPSTSQPSAPQAPIDYDAPYSPSQNYPPAGSQ